jgi:nitrite reductase (NADH) small subunit
MTTQAPVRLAPASALPPGQQVEVDVDGEIVALFRTGDAELYAVAGECLHMAGRLAEGPVADCVVTCPLHQWRYDLRTGRRVDRVGSFLQTYDAWIDDGWIMLGGARPTPTMTTIEEDDA